MTGSQKYFRYQDAFSYGIPILLSTFNSHLQEITMRTFNRAKQFCEFVGKKLMSTEQVSSFKNDVLILEKDGSMRLNYKNEKVQKNIKEHLKSLEKINLKGR